MTSGSRRRLGIYWDEVLTLWLGYGLFFGVAFGVAMTALFWSAGHPLWWILAVVAGLGIAAGLILPWTETR